MGTAWGDFDGDGLEDAYVTRIGQAGLFRNLGDGTFTDEAVARGAARNGMSWGTVFADFDNDGDPDLFVVSTYAFDQTPTLLYRNEGGFFTDVAQQAGARLNLDAFGLAAGDFNRDGRPDLFIPAQDGRNRLLLNETPAVGNWIAVKLTGSTVNRMAVGASVEVTVQGRRLVRTVSRGDSFNAQSSPTLHFGLGNAVRIDTLRVYWGGHAVETTTDLAVNTTYPFREGTLSTAITAAPVLPAAFSVASNFPNPFHTSTTIRFDLPEVATVEVEVLDLLGRTVLTLPGLQMDAGAERLRTLQAGTLPAGTYLYRLTAHFRNRTQTITGTMLLVK